MPLPTLKDAWFVSDGDLEQMACGRDTVMYCGGEKGSISFPPLWYVTGHLTRWPYLLQERCLVSLHLHSWSRYSSLFPPSLPSLSLSSPPGSSFLPSLSSSTHSLISFHPSLLSSFLNHLFLLPPSLYPSFFLSFLFSILPLSIPPFPFLPPWIIFPPSFPLS